MRFAAHYGSRPDFCEGADTESKGLFENLVGYVKSDLMVAEELSVADLPTANGQRLRWCNEVNAILHSEICPIPFERLEKEREPPSLRTQIATLVVRKVDRLGSVRFGSARYSVPSVHIGRNVELVAQDGRVLVVFLGEMSILDEPYVELELKSTQLAILRMGLDACRAIRKC